VILPIESSSSRAYLGHSAAVSFFKVSGSHIIAVINPANDINELAASGIKNGKFMKKVDDPNKSGYCAAGLAKAPPRKDPTIIPVLNLIRKNMKTYRNPNILNPLT
jgi:hypothetical protein